MQRLSSLARLIWQRHRWSVPLALCSALFFAKLASEVSEHQLDWFDVAAQRVVDGWRGRMDTGMVWLTHGGSFPSMTALALAVWWWLLRAQRPREARHLLASALGCLLLNVLLKAIFQRARPDAEPPYLLPRPTSFAFPSGHTMGCAGVLGSLLVIARVLRPPRVAWVAALLLGAGLILGVALSRVYLGAHYPSDVLGGLFASLSWLSVVTGWVYPRLLPHERSTPHPEQTR